MTAEQFDTVAKAQPFKPFAVHLADGTKHSVRHPELVWRTPGGRTIFISLGGERVAIIDLLLVTKITHRNGQRKKREA
jgi:hypothetical protein